MMLSTKYSMKMMMLGFSDACSWKAGSWRVLACWAVVVFSSGSGSSGSGSSGSGRRGSSSKRIISSGHRHCPLSGATSHLPT